MKLWISLVNVNDGHGEGQQRSLKSCVLVDVMVVIVGRGVDNSENKGKSYQ